MPRGWRGFQRSAWRETGDGCRPLPLKDNRSPAMMMADGVYPLGEVFVPEERLYWEDREGA